MIVFAADPGLNPCGLALVDITGSERRLVASDTVYTHPSMDFEARLDEIGRRAFPLMLRSKLVGLEEQGDVWQGQARAGETNAAARKVQDVLSLLRGLAYAAGIPRVVLQPRRIRNLLGLGANGDKAPTGRLVRQIVRDVPAARLISQHAIDAISIALAAEKVAHAVTFTQTRIPGTERVRKKRSRKAGRNSAPTLPGPGDHTTTSARKNREVPHAG